MQKTTLKPLLSGPPIKRAPSIKRTLSRVPKLKSYKLYLAKFDCLNPLLSGHIVTELTIVVLDNVLEILNVVDK